MDNPLLVFLHGPGQSPPAWQDVVSAINPDQPMVAPWLKGLKPNEPAGFDLDAAVESVLDVMEARDAKQADLVGYSLGGVVAARVAMAYPDRIAHLVMVSTPVIPDRKAISAQRMVVRMTPSWLFKGISKELVLSALDALLAADFGIDPALITAPTLVVTAEEDIPMRQSASQLALSEGVVLRHLPGDDPNLMTTHPAQLAQLIADFRSGFLD